MYGKRYVHNDCSTPAHSICEHCESTLCNLLKKPYNTQNKKHFAKKTTEKWKVETKIRI